MEDLYRLLSLSDWNTRVVFLGAGAFGFTAGILGCFTIFRGRALLGDAIAHASLPGVCAAFLLFHERHFLLFLLGALVSGLLSIAFIRFAQLTSRIKEEGAIALAIGFFFGIGIALSRLIQNAPRGNQAGIDSFILGRTASMVSGEAVSLLILSVIVLCIVALFFKEFVLLCFDRAFAAAAGIPIKPLDWLLLLLIAATTVLGLPAVGALLVVALLIMPAAAARFWSDSMAVVLIIAGAIGLLSAVIGTGLSAVLPAPLGSLSRGWPTGPVITLVAASFFGVSLLFGSRRGLLRRMLERPA